MHIVVGTGKNTIQKAIITNVSQLKFEIDLQIYLF